MTLITGSVESIGMAPLSGQLIAQVATFRASGEVLFAPQSVAYPIVQGEVSADLAPGPARLTVQVGSHARDSFDVVIPVEGPVALSHLVEEEFPWEPEQISEFVRLRADAIEAAQQARDARDEAVAAALEWRGDWDPEVEYEPQDVVSHEGSSWRALEPSTGVEPVEGDVWSVLAAAGASGATSWGQIADVPDTFPPDEHHHMIDDLDVAGTPDANTFLRGDGRWATPPTGGDGGSTNAADLTGALTDQVDATDAMVTPTDGEPAPLGGVLGGLRADVEGKADDDHTHDITGLETSNEPSPDTFLRGDGSWAIPEGGGNGGGSVPGNAVLSDTVRNIIVSSNPEAPMEDGDLLITTPYPRVVAVAHSPQSYGTGDSVSSISVQVPEQTRAGDLLVAMVSSAVSVSIPGFEKIVEVDHPGDVTAASDSMGMSTALTMEATEASAESTVTVAQQSPGRMSIVVLVVRSREGVAVESFETASVSGQSPSHHPVPEVTPNGVGRIAVFTGCCSFANTSSDTTIELSDQRWRLVTPPVRPLNPSHERQRSWVGYRSVRNGEPTTASVYHNTTGSSAGRHDSSSITVILRPKASL